MAEIERSGNAPHLADGLGGPDGPVYPGTCRNLSADDRVRRIANRQPHALRLDMARSVATAGPLSWIDAADGPVAAEPAAFGDVVLARKDTPTSYHLAVTVDDHLQGVTLVTRAADLRPATHVHRLLQTLLGFDSPRYLHHRVLTGPSGRRLAKRDNAASIRGLRANGATPAEIRRRAGFEG